MKYLLITLLISLSYLSFSQMSLAPGVIDAHFVSGRFQGYITKIDIGREVYNDLNTKYKNNELKLNENQEIIFESNKLTYPFNISIPYLHLLFEDDHWAVRTMKTINIENSSQGLFSEKGPSSHQYYRERDRTIRTDTVYNEYGNSVFLNIIKEALKTNNITPYLNLKYDVILDETYNPDQKASDSLSLLLENANKIVVKEDYFYNKQNGKTESQIIALGFYNGNKLLFWTYYPEVSYILRNDFTYYNKNFNNQYFTTFDKILKQQQYDIDSLSIANQKINVYDWKKDTRYDTHQEHLTEMNALFYAELIKSYIENNYINYTGKINLKVHNNLTLSTQLISGQIQGICILKNKENLTVLKIEFKNHIPHGNYTEYWGNGNIKEIGRFELGIKEGKWENYFSDNKTMGIRNYRNGWMNGQQELWYKNGNKYMSFNYENFMLNGVYNRFNEKGNLMESGFFRNNYPDQTWKINLQIPQEYLEIILNNKELEWKYPIESYEDGILSYEVQLEQGPKEKNCPSPIYTCVSLISISDVK
jgi:antitoxin component YwqK of YwqJK toxin-antitoxin module